MKTVPDCDYALLRVIHTAMANGKAVILNPNISLQGIELSPEQIQENQFRHAAVLKEFYEFTEQEILELTGFFVQ